MRPLRLAGLLTVVATAPAAAQLAISRPTERLLLLPLAVAVGADSAFSVRVMDVARERLHKLARYKVIVIPKPKICEALEASGFPCDGLMGEQQARQLARFLDADAYAVGALVRDGPAHEARIRILDIGGSGFSYAFTVREARRGGVAGNAYGMGAEGLGESVAQRLNSLVRAGERARECEAQRQRGEFPAALDLARKALESEPDLPAAHLCTATVYEAQRANPDSIISAARRALAGDSLNTHALETIARQHQIKGDTVEALQYFERLVGADPGNNVIGLGLAAEYQRRRDFEGAVRVLRTLVEQTRDEQVAERLYQVCIEGGRWGCVLDLVAARVQRDTALLGDSATLKIAIGAAQSRPDTQALLRYSAEAVRRFPQDRSFIGVRGAAFELAGRPDSALVWYTRAYQADSSAPNALRVAKTIVEAAAYDTAGVGSDTTRLPARRTALAERLAVADPFLRPWVRSPDAAVRLNALALTLSAGAKLAQAQAYDAAYPWLENVLSALATDTAAATAAPREQLRTSASFWYGVASVVTSGSAYRDMTASRSCARAREFFDRIQRTRAALERGRSVHEPTAAQMLRAVAQYEGATASVKQAFQCTNF